ncbi:hypothetical protein DRO91_10260 [Candidatus Heimdallarchaeota archaeon]|nr:hypothetical protein [Candidatus Heimdallarchaeota archaeon]RLI67403.1 MAG: hypothetical protein DRO91_10260 [Candidatus Heimdallarchaeota archaeon]RLI68229.1 MAG: hypothetical protein DRP02_12990 [Candidatus Gerdarchaeota archaeon]
MLSFRNIKEFQKLLKIDKPTINCYLLEFESAYD